MNFKCEFCGKEYTNEKFYLAHIENCKSKPEELDKWFKKIDKGIVEEPKQDIKPIITTPKKIGVQHIHPEISEREINFVNYWRDNIGDRAVKTSLDKLAKAWNVLYGTEIQVSGSCSNCASQKGQELKSLYYRLKNKMK
jgi:hypothetical protein